jgi:hypothetical protein
MTSIQLLLITLTLLGVMFGSFVFRSRLLYRSLAVLFAIAACWFILFPDLTTKIANVLGVRRGADLLLYLSVLAGIHGFLLLYWRTRRLEEKLTEIIRAITIRNAQEFKADQPRSKEGDLNSRVPAHELSEVNQPGPNPQR